MILETDFMTASEQLFKVQNWLPFPKRVQYHTCLMVYTCKSITGQAPEYIPSMLTYVSEHYERQTRLTVLDLLHIPRSHSAYFDLRNKTKSLVCTAKKAFFENAINENWDNSFLWKRVKDITGQSQANKLPSALQSDQGPINNPQEIIDEMYLYFAKVSDRLIKDKRPFGDRIADVLKELINSKKPENIHFNVPLIKSYELKSRL